MEGLNRLRETNSQWEGIPIGNGPSLRGKNGYLKTSVRTAPSIGPLISDDKVQLQHDEMAEEFNRYFTCVFTKENTAEIPSAAPLF